MALSFQMVFFLRRYLTLLILTLLPTFSLSQIFVQMASTIIVIAYLWNVRPYKSPLLNFIETINEVTVLVAAYPLLTFTNWIDLFERGSFGWYLISCICFNVIFNAVFALSMMVRHIYLICKLKMIKKRRLAEIEKRVKRL